MQKKRILINLSIASLLTLSSSIVLASAFQTFEENASGLGNAYAGMAVNDNNDATTESSNPAGMVLLTKPEVDVSTVVIDAHSQFNGTHATNYDGEDITNSGQRISYPLGVNYIPAVHYVLPIDQKWFLGFGLTIPFGLSASCSKTSMVRYFSTNSTIMTLNIGPDIAYRLTPKFSLGAGVGIQYLSTELDQQIDLGELYTNSGTTLSMDGTMKNHATGWSWSGVVGALYQFSKQTRVGFAYHKPVSYRLTGASKVYIPSTLNSLQRQIAENNGFVNNRITTHFILPEMAVLSFYQGLSSQWSTVGTISYTRWSRFKDLTIRFHSKIPATTVHEDFRDTMRYALGINYAFNTAWLFRLGLAFDQSPTDSAHRTIRLPDANRVWWSGGLQYTLWKQVAINVGYTYVYIHNGSLTETAPGPTPGVNYLISGDFTHNHANLFGAQINWQI